MSLKWNCYGKYFSLYDVGSYGTAFENGADVPAIVLANGTVESVKRNDDNLIPCYCHSAAIVDGVGKLTYHATNELVIDEHPVKISFKARLYQQENSDTVSDFFLKVKIIYKNISDAYTPCFSISLNDDDLIPFTPEMIKGEWFNFEALWVNGVTYINLNGNCIFEYESENILAFTDKDLTISNESANLGFDIANLEICKIVPYYEKLFIDSEIVNDDNKFTITLSSNFEDTVIEETPEYIQLQFAELTPNQKICIQNLTIEDCTFVSEEYVYLNSYLVKTYKDNITNKNFKVHIFNNPTMLHDDNLNNNYLYRYYINKSDTFNILFSVKYVDIDLSGRLLTLTQDDNTYPCIFNVFMNQWLYTSVERVFNTVKFLIPDIEYVNNAPAYVPELEPVYPRHNIKFELDSNRYSGYGNYEGYGVDLDTIRIEECNFIRNEYINEFEINKVYYNTIAKKEFKIHIYNNDGIPLNAGSQVIVKGARIIYMEFVSEGLETKEISFRCKGVMFSGTSSSPSLLKFYFDDDFRMQHTNLPNERWQTYTFEIPII